VLRGGARASRELARAGDQVPTLAGLLIDVGLGEVVGRLLGRTVRGRSSEDILKADASLLVSDVPAAASLVIRPD
jgi:hypothetical protein